MTKMAKIDTLFMTKAAENPTYVAHIREYPPSWLWRALESKRVTHGKMIVTVDSLVLS